MTAESRRHRRCSASSAGSRSRAGRRLPGVEIVGIANRNPEKGDAAARQLRHRARLRVGRGDARRTAAGPPRHHHAAGDASRSTSGCGVARGIPTICQKPFGTSYAGSGGDGRAGRNAPACRWSSTRTSASSRGIARRSRLLDVRHDRTPALGRLPHAPGRRPGPARLPRPAAVLPVDAALPDRRNGDPLHRHLPLPDRRGRGGDRAAAPDEPGRSPARTPAT